MQLQRLAPSHASEYRALMLEAYQLHPDAFTSSSAERAMLPITWWEQRLQLGPQPAALVFGAFQEQQLAGVAGLSFESRERLRHKATLFGMYVPSRFRRLGLGGQLVRAALDEAGAHPGITVVQLTVTHGNVAAQRLYQRHGFAPFGVEPFAVAVGGGFVSKVHMWRGASARQDNAKA
jgi:ribosomal protein S18 acetylase RimI-like enzyme